MSEGTWQYVFGESQREKQTDRETERYRQTEPFIGKVSNKEVLIFTDLKLADQS